MQANKKYFLENFIDSIGSEEYSVINYPELISQNLINPFLSPDNINFESGVKSQ